MTNAALASRRRHLGPYEVHDRVGRGGMGTVWRAFDLRSWQEVALKVLRTEHACNPRAAALLRQELTISRMLDHRGIGRVLEEGTVPENATRGPRAPWVAGSPFLAMEFLSGAPMHSWSTYWSYSTLLDGLLQVLSALGHVHGRGVLHRDVKPGNLLVCGDRVVLTDFGLAVILRPDGRRGPGGGGPVGSPSYMAPEQVRGDEGSQGPWTDLYGLGCTAWHMAVGRPPFRGTTSEILAGQLGGSLPEFAPRVAVAPGFEAWLRRLLAPKPADRFECAAEAAAALLALEHRPLTPAGTVLRLQPGALAPPPVTRLPPPALVNRL